MCFSIPLKIIKVDKNTAITEGGLNVFIDEEFVVNTGDYVRVLGNIVVDKLSKNEGLKIRKLLKNLN